MIAEAMERVGNDGVITVEEAKGLIEPQELQTWRLLYGPPKPYTRERFEDTYAWMLGYPGLLEAGATYEQVVDNRAWE